MVIDLKDRKILYALDRDARRPFSSIGKEVGLSKGGINYRIKRLFELGIIRGFYPVIDVAKLGYSIYRFYIKLDCIPPSVKEEIIRHFVNYPYSGIIHEAEGEYDIVVYIFVKDLKNFYDFWSLTLDRYSSFFTSQKLSVYFRDNIFRYSFLLGEKRRTDLSCTKVYGEGGLVNVDSIDSKILYLLSKNARMPSSRIASLVGTSASLVSWRIRRLIEKGVIRCFKVNISIGKLGYKGYKLDIALRDRKARKKIIEYIKFNPNLVCIDETIGYTDLEFGFFLKNDWELYSIIHDLLQRFSDSIRDYRYFSVSRVRQFNYLPKNFPR